jgi:hypothetical protein
MVALGLVALLGANMSWAQSKRTTIKAKTTSGKIVNLPWDDAKIVNIPSTKLEKIITISPEELKSRKSLKGLPGVKAVDPSAIYSNVTTTAGNVINPGGAAAYSTGFRTLPILDDTNITVVTSWNGIRMTTSNGNGADVQGRILICSWTDNAGVPDQWQFAGCIGYTFGAAQPMPVGVTLWRSDLTSFGRAFPQAAMWTGFCYDNLGGDVPMSQAELNNMGQLLAGPVDVGSSSSNLFFGDWVGSQALSPPTGTMGSNAEHLALEFDELPPVPVELQMFTAD